jgi:hypothetical protein
MLNLSFDQCLQKAKTAYFYSPTGEIASRGNYICITRKPGFHHEEGILSLPRDLGLLTKAPKQYFCKNNTS